MFLNNRYHDPTLGQFVSVDPLVVDTGDVYLYGGANPITNADPSGLCFVRTPTGSTYDDGLGPCPNGEYYDDGPCANASTWTDSFCSGSHPEPPEPWEPDEFTLGVDWDFCVFLCVPDVGLSSEGFYIRPGVGVGLEAPNLEISDEAPECGARATIAEASVGLGVSGTPLEAGGGAEAVRQYGSSSWSTNAGFGVSVNTGEGADLPGGGRIGSSGLSYYGVSASASLHHEVTLC